jgi:hypothetical protein
MHRRGFTFGAATILSASATLSIKDRTHRLLAHSAAPIITMPENNRLMRNATAMIRDINMTMAPVQSANR